MAFATAAVWLAGLALASPASAGVEQHIEISQCTHTSGNNQGCNEKPGATMPPQHPVAWSADPRLGVQGCLQRQRDPVHSGIDTYGLNEVDDEVLVLPVTRGLTDRADEHSLRP